MAEDNNQYNKIIIDAYNRSKEIVKQKETAKHYESNEKATNKVAEFKEENLNTLAAQRVKERNELTKKNIANDFKDIAKILIIGGIIVSVIFVPGVRNGIAKLIGNPITAGLNIIWLFCLIYPICYIGYWICKATLIPFIEIIMDIFKKRKELKDSNQYKK